MKRALGSLLSMQLQSVLLAARRKIDDCCFVLYESAILAVHLDLGRPQAWAQPIGDVEIPVRGLGDQSPAVMRVIVHRKRWLLHLRQRLQDAHNYARNQAGH